LAFSRCLPGISDPCLFKRSLVPQVPRAGFAGSPGQTMFKRHRHRAVDLPFPATRSPSFSSVKAISFHFLQLLSPMPLFRLCRSLRFISALSGRHSLPTRLAHLPVRRHARAHLLVFDTMHCCEERVVVIESEWTVMIERWADCRQYFSTPGELAASARGTWGTRPVAAMDGACKNSPEAEAQGCQTPDCTQAQYTFVQKSDVQPYFDIATNYGFAKLHVCHKSGAEFPRTFVSFVGNVGTRCAGR